MDDFIIMEDSTTPPLVFKSRSCSDLQSIVKKNISDTDELNAIRALYAAARDELGRAEREQNFDRVRKLKYELLPFWQKKLEELSNTYEFVPPQQPSSPIPNKPETEKEPETDKQPDLDPFGNSYVSTEISTPCKHTLLFIIVCSGFFTDLLLFNSPYSGMTSLVIASAVCNILFNVFHILINMMCLILLTPLFISLLTVCSFVISFPITTFYLGIINVFYLLSLLD